MAWEVYMDKFIFGHIRVMNMEDSMRLNELLIKKEEQGLNIYEETEFNLLYSQKLREHEINERLQRARGSEIIIDMAESFLNKKDPL